MHHAASSLAGDTCVPNTIELERNHFGWVVATLCATHRIPFDPRLIDQEFPPPHARQSLLRVLPALGLRCAEVSWTSKSLETLNLPAIAFTATPSPIPALILRVDDDRVLYLTPDSSDPKIVARSMARGTFAGGLILVSAPQSAEGSEAQSTPEIPARFGFRWFVPELLRHKSIWRDVLLASLAIQLVGLGTPLFTQVVIDKVVVHQTQSTLVTIVIAMAVFVVFSAAMTWIRQYLVLHTGNRVDAVLGATVFRHLIRLPIAYFENRPTGTLIARLQGVEDIRQFVSGAAVSLILDIPFLAVFVTVMFLYSPMLTLIALGMLAALVILSLIVTPRFRSRLNRQFMLGARNQAFVTEYVSGMSTVKSLQLESTLERRYGDYLATYLGASFDARKLSNTYNVSAGALEQAMGLAILACGALLVMRNDGFTIGMLVAFQMFVSRMTQPVMRLVGLWLEFQQASIAVKRLGDILDMPMEPYSLTPQRAPARGPGRVDFQNVSFRYSERHPYLYRNLIATLKPGRLTVLLGPSGCGKSTLAKLLQGFYQPSDGAIKVDGCDIRYLTANELRATLGVVPQETVLFSGTVYDNLLMANPGATFDDIVAAAKQAEIHAVVEQLPQGYQTAIGEHGVGLSGGQRQRIAIARALLKRPKILIFDEATSSLDQSTAEAFAKTINGLKGEVTMLFIAHLLPRNLAIDDVLQFGGARRQAMARVPGASEMRSENQTNSARGNTCEAQDQSVVAFTLGS